MNTKSLAAFGLAASVAPLVAAGPLAFILCQTGCTAFRVSCYSAAGPGANFFAIFGASPAIMACNAVHTACMGMCVAAGAGPTP